MTGREIALKALYEIEENGMYSNQALKAALSHPGLNDADRGLVTELVLGVQKNKIRLDHCVMQFSKVKLKKMTPWVRNILRMGIYQMVDMDKIPHSAACNESVKLARRYAHQAASGFVNGVLRSVARNLDAIVYPERNHPVEYLSVLYSYPVWMVEKLLEQFGLDECEAILRESNLPHPVTLRVNPLKIRPEELPAILAREGIRSAQDCLIPYCVRVEGAIDVTRSKAYQDGLYTPQNTSSMRAVEVLDPQPGELVLDVCAAPGGKTTQIAERMEDRGRIVAFDIHPHKAELIKAAAARLGLNSISAQIQDASVPVTEYIGKADRVLVDAPCSGLGVIHKKPDIKWTRQETDIQALAGIQAKILDTACQYVRPGGVLVYSTCTILCEENETQTERFLDRHPEFIKAKEDLLLTHQTGGSGFYLCRLEKYEN